MPRIVYNNRSGCVKVCLDKPVKSDNSLLGSSLDNSGGWSTKIANIQNPGASVGYDKEKICNGPCHTSSGGSSCGACTGTATLRSQLKTGLDKTCPHTYSEISVGHGMYPGQECGECVLLKCVDGPDADSKCLDTTSFLHQRVDDPSGTSNEISVSSFCKRWGCSVGGVRSQNSSDTQWSAGAKNFYSYKKADCTTGNPI